MADGGLRTFEWCHWLWWWMRFRIRFWFWLRRMLGMCIRCEVGFTATVPQLVVLYVISRHTTGITHHTGYSSSPDDPMSWLKKIIKYHTNGDLNQPLANRQFWSSAAANKQIPFGHRNQLFTDIHTSIHGQFTHVSKTRSRRTMPIQDSCMAA